MGNEDFIKNLNALIIFNLLIHPFLAAYPGPGHSNLIKLGFIPIYCWEVLKKM